MLELQEFVLEKVCENKLLFVKELQKSFQWLDQDDLIKLYKWSIQTFNDRYRNIIDCVYAGFDLQNSLILSN